MQRSAASSPEKREEWVKKKETLLRWKSVVAGGWIHKRNPLYHVASKCGISKKEQWAVEDVC